MSPELLIRQFGDGARSASPAVASSDHDHVHAVVSANKKPEAIVSALKANATRAMKEAGIWTSELSPWSFGGSRKNLWNDKELADAIAYVEGDQGEPLD